jgi:hypothetical protein
MTLFSVENRFSFYMKRALLIILLDNIKKTVYDVKEIIIIVNILRHFVQKIARCQSNHPVTCGLLVGGSAGSE